jgi:hypothetical protein
MNVREKNSHLLQVSRVRKRPPMGKASGLDAKIAAEAADMSI